MTAPASSAAAAAAALAGVPCSGSRRLGAGLLLGWFSFPAAAAAAGLLLLNDCCCCSAVSERLAVQGDGDSLGALQGAKGCLLGLHSALLGDSTLASDCLVGDRMLLCSDMVPEDAATAAAGLLQVAGLLLRPWCVQGELLLLAPSLCGCSEQVLPSRAGSKDSALADGVDVSSCQAVGGGRSR